MVLIYIATIEILSLITAISPCRNCYSRAPRILQVLRDRPDIRSTYTLLPRLVSSLVDASSDVARV